MRLSHQSAGRAFDRIRVSDRSRQLIVKFSRRLQAGYLKKYFDLAGPEIATRIKGHLSAVVAHVQLALKVLQQAICQKSDLARIADACRADRAAPVAWQQISREEVLSLYTRQNGWFLREEDQLGTIESGKLADLVVLNGDYFAVPNEDLKKIRSVLTVVGGNVVYDGGVLDLRD